ncbi:hypothetical protein G9A89_018213 [Geosiphon pyriformis]|nr:hypothetical protein G9A89_018213 [Geosiphon pyriformis]
MFNGQHAQVPAMCEHFKNQRTKEPLIEFKDTSIFGRPKQQGKWDHMPCLACDEILSDKGLWNDVPGRGGTCDEACQYTILINNWVRKETPIEDA